MDPIKKDHDTPGKGEIRAAVRVYWSQQRAWHGDTLKLFVRTEAIKDGTNADLTISKKASNTIDTADKLKDLSVSTNVIDKDYTIDWKSQGLSGCLELLLKASLKPEGGTLDSEPSPSLFVDLVEPGFSM